MSAHSFESSTSARVFSNHLPPQDHQAQIQADRALIAELRDVLDRLELRVRDLKAEATDEPPCAQACPLWIHVPLVCSSLNHDCLRAQSFAARFVALEQEQRALSERLDHALNRLEVVRTHPSLPADSSSACAVISLQNQLGAPFGRACRVTATPATPTSMDLATRDAPLPSMTITTMIMTMITITTSSPSLARACATMERQKAAALLATYEM